jgi:hypothetical protein
MWHEKKHRHPATKGTPGPMPNDLSLSTALRNGLTAPAAPFQRVERKLRHQCLLGWRRAPAARRCPARLQPPARQVQILGVAPRAEESSWRTARACSTTRAA